FASPHFFLSAPQRFKQTRISSLTTILIAILHWIWPPDRCTNCHSIYSSPHLEENGARDLHSVSQIQRSVDGRFVIAGTKSGSNGKLNALTNGNELDGIDEVDATPTSRNSHASQNSSSDDGGFLSRRNFITARASWRRPLVAAPSQLSLQSAVGSARGFLQGLGGLLRVGSNSAVSGSNNGLAGFTAANMASPSGEDVAGNTGARYQNIYRGHYGHNIYRNLQPAQPASRPLHINTLSGGGTLFGGHQYHQQHVHGLNLTPNIYTPSRISRIFSSSPASTPNDTLGGGTHHHIGGGLNAGAPLGSGGFLSSPWSMATPGSGHMHTHFSDLSSVYPGSAERSLPTLSATSGNLSRYRYYAQELPSLRTIQEETRRYNQQQHQEEQQQQQQQDLLTSDGFVPLQIPSPPAWRNYYSTQLPYHSYRPRTRWYPRHYARLFGRTHPEQMSPLPHLNLTLRSASVGAMGLEASPESRSSSSGFGSKNTSNHPQGSHHSGSTSEWRLLPPYRPPPPPPLSSSAYFGLAQPSLHQQAQGQGQAPASHHHQQLHHPSLFGSSSLPYYPHYGSVTAGSLQQQHHHHYQQQQQQQRPTTPPYTMEHWLGMISDLNAATDNVHLPKSVDVGSVDGHYEFDPATPTPSVSTPTGGLLREDLNLHVDTTGHHTLGPLSSAGIFQHATSSALTSGAATYGGPMRKTRFSRYDNVEARLQAMREEFYEYRKRQAMQQAGVAELESVC
ncbi:PREDICTED: protein turtle-like, partial [Rhagoletis zephyria]|uniref:protein turtle-like n=1 Tax=Rhagoletis zephyria TaxID=28612 RepID=UPI000811A151